MTRRRRRPSTGRRRGPSKLARGTRDAARRSAVVFTRFTAGLHAAAIALLALTAGTPPAGSDVFALLWLREQRPIILLAGAMWAAAGVLTAMACAIRGPHRRWLIAVWGIAAVLTVLIAGDRLAAWVRLLILYYG
ncbi:MAG: hypothetical protein AAGB29_05290 [Planctomycetota bacterium]